MKTDFKGTGVALVTPMHEDLSIDYKGLESVLEHINQAQVEYIVALGTTGEASTLSDKEKKEFVNAVLKNNPRRVPIVLGLGGNDTKALVHKIKETDFSGIDAILSVNPYYNKPVQSGLLAHYTAIADACPVPVILYNIPGRTASNMTAETTLKLAQHPNIIGIKEASGDFSQCIEIVRNKPKDFFLTAGDDILTVPIVSIGGVGSISAISNAFPDIMVKMTHAALKDDFKTANNYLHQFSPINRLLFEEGNPVGVKTLLHIMGICKPFVRLPLVQGSEALFHALKQKYHQFLQTNK